MTSDTQISSGECFNENFVNKLTRIIQLALLSGYIQSGLQITMQTLTFYISLDTIFITKQALISLLVTTQALIFSFSLRYSCTMCKFVHVSSIIDSIYHIILLLYYSFFGSNNLSFFFFYLILKKHRFTLMG